MAISLMSSWISVPKRKKQIPPTSTFEKFIPTFHILIATSGRPCLFNMLHSLKDELTSNDAITIVFDGEGAIQRSTFSDDWLKGHQSNIKIIEQTPNLGYWGHAIRNKYQGILEPKTTFIMNADDDDIYVSGSFQKLRQLCINKNTLYIAKFLVKHNNVQVPSQLIHIIQDDIGTPCGIIPFELANKSNWEYKYGGDFDYYNKLKEYVSDITFLNTIIYIVD
uniref:Glycosyltransferase 2-like domain-containing protein n=1 Tax=viral metagenome TaxID=1070528 RepID=A0A6C0KLN2_9ZZZZ